ncbi:MAG: sporulation initiation factor Spo0A C-terminal domain-containing protein [Clostridia bacterium]|nr:sporulation initiation factor Spo0A C-terminal domain-containing protein [Clostridia bacterium]
MQTVIHQALHELHLSGTYRGFRQLAIAVELVLEDENRLFSVIREIYYPVSLRCGCRIETIERNIRTVIYHIWRTRRKRLFEMVGYPLEVPPTASELIDILAGDVRRTYPVAK